MFKNFECKLDLAKRKKLHCNDCRRNTIHSLEAECVGSWEDGHVSGGQSFSTYRCGACDSVCYETSSWDSEGLDHDEDGNLFAVMTVAQYPPPSSANFAFNTEYIPFDLANLIEEMMYAFAGVRLTLSTIGIRLVIEFIVNDQKCAGGNLKQKIDNLKNQGFVDEPQRDLLHKIRDRGNAGAHSGKPMTKSELIAGMGIVQMLLEKLYNGPARNAELMEKAGRVFKTKD